ncbi:uncharacterized protein LOC123668743 [Melitaea cinxia]|uniref:uncharacterized protein LOC123668743 n=1 Tax=Melitaea cinxia TaxID=113334 RepID=UPI001E2712BB|nr:uncharacterized protein LOC123668743 [Melitaea cinxia]
MVASKGYVRYLEQRIKTVFDLRGPFCLCTDGYLLPSSEPLALLAPGDVIEVVPLEETQESSPPAVHVKEEKEAPHQENSRTAVDGRMNDPYFLELYARRRQTLESLRSEHRFLLNMDLLRTERAEAPPRRVRWGTRSPEPRAEPERDQP